MVERKATFLTIALWVMFSLVLSPRLVVPVRAYGYDYGYGCASVMHACDANPTTPSELKYIYWLSITYTIFLLSGIITIGFGFGILILVFGVRGDPVYGHLTHSMVWNNGDPYSTTTKDDVLNGIKDVEANHAWSSFLYVGHGGMQYFEGSMHYAFFMNGKGKDVAGGQVPQVWDVEIYPRVTETPAWNNHHFVFLWACFNGHERGSYETFLPNGMPYCWTEGKIGPSTDGYASPDGSNYCFIGFDLASPRLEEPHNGPNHLHKHWLVFFYYYTVAQSYSVRQALDKASQCQEFEDFTKTRLYKKGPYYPKSGPPGGQEIDEWKDTYFLGLRNPENPDGSMFGYVSTATEITTYRATYIIILGDICEEPW
ncbi:MAG: hypothetical protein QXT26_03555 [Thermoproteota archaeon]